MSDIYRKTLVEKELRGQALCSVEAMKTETVTAGDSLAVDDVIMEFE